MNEFYRAWINDAETESLSFFELAKMAEANELMESTPVRNVLDEQWSTWGQVSQQKVFRRALTDLGATFRTAPAPRATRYPARRQWIVIILVFFSVVAAVSWANFAIHLGETAGSYDSESDEAKAADVTAHNLSLFWWGGCAGSMTVLLPILCLLAFTAQGVLDIADCAARREQELPQR